MTDSLSLLCARYPHLAVCGADIQNAFEILRDCFASGGKLLVCGNGGSAADAEHIVGELMKSFVLPRKLSAESREKFIAGFGDDGARLAEQLEGALPAISLVNQSSLISATVNDGAPDLLFAQQVWGYGKSGDAILAISTSGNSPNIVRALQTARVLKMKTVGLTGQNGGAMKALCDACICCPSSSTPEIQEMHLPIYHTLCIMLENEFFPNAN